ncbi:hypothetical protein [Phycobacter sp. K97]|uniref:hypothetical protein n=1 Tax=Phycobacter sedimenti TaxID=3133977 RepID=UPI00311D2ED7
MAKLPRYADRYRRAKDARAAVRVAGVGGFSMSVNTLLALAAAGALLMGCGSSFKDRTLYDGIAFKAKAKPVDKKVSRADFRVEVSKASQSYKGARLAAHHAGVTYCLTDAGYGTSEIVWDVDPYDPDAELRLDGDTAVFHGTCQS